MVMGDVDCSGECDALEVVSDVASVGESVARDVGVLGVVSGDESVGGVCDVCGGDVGGEKC